MPIMTILLTCRRCKGTGVVPNDQYRICQELKSHDIKKYFHMPTEDMVSDDDLAEQNGCNTVTETIACPVCDGAGSLAFDDDEWDIQIIADEEDVVEV